MSKLLSLIIITLIAFISFQEASSFDLEAYRHFIIRDN